MIHSEIDINGHQVCALSFYFPSALEAIPDFVWEAPRESSDYPSVFNSSFPVNVGTSSEVWSTNTPLSNINLPSVPSEARGVESTCSQQEAAFCVMESPS